jgi:O-antigen ligase
VTPSDPVSSEFREHLAESIRVLQIIVAALVVSCLILTVVAATLLSIRDGDPPPDDPQTLAYVALGAVVAAFVLAAAVSRAVVTSARRRLARGERKRSRPHRRIPWQQAEFQARFGDQARLNGIYVTKTILAAAILEGAAYLGLGAFYITRNPLALAATLAALAGIAATFPTLSRVENWIADQRRLLEEECALAQDGVSF